MQIPVEATQDTHTRGGRLIDLFGDERMGFLGLKLGCLCPMRSADLWQFVLQGILAALVWECLAVGPVT